MMGLVDRYLQSVGGYMYDGGVFGMRYQVLNLSEAG